MRIAFSGAHRTGKTSLVEALGTLLPSYAVAEEPYRLLEDEGHELADPPSVDDFELQLRRSIELLAEARTDILFDRCPLDFVAYLKALDDDFDVEPWLDELRESLRTLDLLVLVPIEAPDRIAIPAHEDRRLRCRVDELLAAMALDDAYGVDVATLEVTGGVDERIGQVMRALRASR